MNPDNGQGAAAELIRLAHKVKYEMAEGFRDEINTFELNEDALTALENWSAALAKAAGVSIEVAEVAFVEWCVRSYLDKEMGQQSN